MRESHYPVSVKTINVIRLENYWRLVGEIEREQNQKPTGVEIARRLDIAAPYVTQLKKGVRKNIQDDAARKMEAGMGKPRGWMDNDPTLWPFQTISPGRFNSLPTHWKGIAEGEVRRVLEEWESSKGNTKTG